MMTTDQSSISKSKLEELLETPLSDTRDNWRGLCPFHLESTASFYIHKLDLVGHCFGCGVAGRLDVLIAKKQETSPQKARALLGLKSLPWLDSLGNDLPPPDPIYPNSWIRAWKRINNHPYMAKRGFTEDVIRTFDCRWDPQQRRVVIPLHHPGGKVVGAVGRSTDGRDPKYYFYWNCDKGQSIWTAADFWTREHDSIIVVEGIVDCMWMWQNGYSECVSLIGASGTSSQIKQLKEFSTVTIALDNDTAGRNGALKLGDSLNNSCNIQYAVYPTLAKDVQDLKKDEIDEVFSNLITPLQMKLNG